MKRKFKIILAVLSSLCLSAAATACINDNPTGQPSTVEYEIASGFDIESEMSVLQYTPVTPEIPLVLLSNGEPVDIVFEVRNSQGEYVEVNGGGFIAMDKGGYTVEYVAIYNGQVLERKVLTVKVQSSAIAVSATYDDYVEIGSTVQIRAQASEEVTFSYAVTCNGNAVDVSETGAFTPTKAGKHDVTITATSSAGVKGAYSYSTYARRVGMVGEIETFGEDWNDYVKTSSVTRPGWERVSTEETSLMYGENAGGKLLDRFGMESEYISFTTSGISNDDTGNSYLNIQVDPRYDLEYYEALASEGYEYVSIWIYIDGQNKHMNYIRTEGSSSSLFSVLGSGTNDGLFALDPNENPENPSLKPGEWTELRLGLYDGALGRKDWKRSFISGYPFYQNGATFVRIENSPEYLDEKMEVKNTWNIYGQEPGQMTIYVGGIFAKRKTVQVSIDFAKNEVFDAAKAVDENGSLYVGSGFTYEAYENGVEIPPEDWDSFSIGMHDLEIRVLKDGQLYETRSVELAVVDTDGIASLQAVTNDKEIAFSVENGTPSGSLTVETPAGKSSPHYKFSFAKSQCEQPGMKLLPALSKHALQQFEGGYLFFDYYVHGSGISTYKLFTVANDKWYVEETAVKDRWTTVYVPVSYLIENYEEYYNGFAKKSHAGKLISFGNWEKKEGYFYVSEVRIIKNLNATVTSSVALSEEELTDEYTISAAKLAELGLTGKTLTAELDGVKSANGTKVSILGREAGDELLYEIYIEFPESGFRHLAYSEKIFIVDNTVVQEFSPIDLGYAKYLEYAMPAQADKHGQLSIVSNPEGKTGNYFQILYKNGNCEPGVRVNPTMDRAVLEKYVGGKLKFDIWVSAEQSTINVLCNKLDDKGKALYLKQQTLQQNAWNTVEISVEELLAVYDDIVANFNERNNLGKLFSFTYSENRGDGTIYFGNLRIEPKKQEMKVEETPIDYEQVWGNNNG